MKPTPEPFLEDLRNNLREELRGYFAGARISMFNLRAFKAGLPDPEAVSHSRDRFTRDASECRRLVGQLRALDAAMWAQSVLWSGGVQQKAALDERAATVRWLYAEALSGNQWQRALFGVFKLAADFIERGEHRKTKDST